MIGRTLSNDCFSTSIVKREVNMSVSSLIKTHNEISQTLISAIKQGEDEQIQAADHALELNLERILVAEPLDGSTKLELLEFFLGILKPVVDRSSVDQRVCDRLRRICEKTLGADQLIA